ncbi:S24 family peptidase [Zooshikella ganghwensis]|uniref:Peptidase S24/S26A/S26B/S26C domain-containing protein n=2 Tax=Zooshikella ganghwensis TaxID=202772 RepID=A0A4P9VGJ2_9GAMM|nr:S24 family peptidase [Zooshikella ganghwensis]RDH41469.1 hypothetical protein B9G39_28040 [Zooshikella ganghwensis]
MEPTIKAGCFAIANMEATGIIERDLYVLKVEDKYCVRWVEPTIDGDYKIESDQNDPFFMPNCTVTPMELTQIEIIGRVELIISSRD